MRKREDTRTGEERTRRHENGRGENEKTREQEMGGVKKKTRLESRGEEQSRADTNAMGLRTLGAKVRQVHGLRGQPADGIGERDRRWNSGRERADGTGGGTGRCDL
ncbi:hypothetical protein GCM10009588_25620 [Microbacterium phyllosphaerae]